MQESLKLPELGDWLLGQSSRQDSVGTIARLYLLQSELVRSVGTEKWINDLIEGKILAFHVEEALTAYNTCINELTTTGHSETYPSWMRNQDHVTDASWVKHRANANISADEYLNGLQIDLKLYLESKTIIYLDTCHWIFMRDVLLGKNNDQNRNHTEILNKLRELKAKNKIICPFSFPLYHELNKQTDATRRVMAELIDEFSEGICIQSPDQIQKAELWQQMLVGVVGDQAIDLSSLTCSPETGVT